MVREHWRTVLSLGAFVDMQVLGFVLGQVVNKICCQLIFLKYANIKISRACVVWNMIILKYCHALG